MKLLDHLQKVDEEISAHLVFQEDYGWKHRIAALIGHSCDSWYWLIGLALVWFFSRGTIRATAFLWALALGLLAVAVLGIKFLLRRPRRKATGAAFTASPIRIRFLRGMPPEQ